jgi:hypothetical protein
MNHTPETPATPQDPLGFIDRLADAHLSSLTEERIDMLRAAFTFFQRNQPYSATPVESTLPVPERTDHEEQQLQ